MSGPPIDSGIELDRASDRFPGRVAAFHVLRVESGLAERDGCLASDVKSVSAEHDHRIRFRQFADPLLDAFRIAPDSAVHDVLLPRNIGPRASIDDLERRAGVPNSFCTRGRGGSTFDASSYRTSTDAQSMLRWKVS